MALTSPLFQSSFDLLSHAIEHFNSGTEKDRKFVILHLANSVELIFKDLLLDLGLSIYKNPKETITISSSIETLSKQNNIVIPHLNKLELLIDERNGLQHRYGFPNELTTIFYMDATYDFFKEFLDSNYNLEVDKILEDFLTPEDFTIFKLREASSLNELDKLNKLSKIHPIGALLSAYAYLERQTNLLKENYLSLQSSNPNLKPFIHPDNIFKYIELYNINFNPSLKNRMFEFRRLRNQAAHGVDSVNTNDVNDFINYVKEIEPLIKNLEISMLENPQPINDYEKERTNSNFKIDINYLLKNIEDNNTNQ